ncbi:hypothetical protein BO78DRAFT_425538 [Aspergillus sclerotiicarbonarius CBS 121057]|uniref:Uncharacterized protein n=1 Tax=Aspergillus sclerotiicarbonarius (strain CBS 121057 / IBT 28362) TaxID=1448318 RepID=A0A319EMW9_ASPSB|nr:hypothetical protein BO78DRAFT_425538 [Aspergillus sclerotiicarbonarius CBS 121057]
MATKAVNDFVTRAEELLGIANGFRTTVTVPVSLTEPDKGTQEKFYFILQSVDFVLLQSYARTGLLLPASKESFEDTYPQNVFEEYVDGPLYNRMRDVLVDIQNHCYVFDAEALNHIILLGGSIGNFAKIASENAGELMEDLQTITSPATSRDPNETDNAIKSAQRLIDEIKNHAVKANDECLQATTKLSKFQTQTTVDDTQFQQVKTKLEAALPTLGQLQQSTDTTIQSFQKELRSLMESHEITKMQNLTRDNNRWNGEGFDKFCVDLMEEAAHPLITIITKNTLRDLKSDYQVRLDKGKETLSSLQLLTQHLECLTSAITNINSTITGVHDALQTLCNRFNNLKTNLDGLKSNLEDARGWTEQDTASLRERAKKRLERASTNWSNVEKLAFEFQRTGMITPETAPPVRPSRRLEILAATFDSEDVTDLVSIMFYKGASLEVETSPLIYPKIVKNIIPDPVDDDDASIFQYVPWIHRAIPKLPPQKVHPRDALSFIFTDGDKRGLFVSSCPGRNTILGPDNWETCPNASAFIPPKQPADALIHIQAIVYGTSVINDKEAFDYAYESAKSPSRELKWDPDSFKCPQGPEGRDYGFACIYYIIEGQKRVRTLAGKSGEKTKWPLSACNLGEA